VHPTIVAAQLVGLNKRLGVFVVESDFRESRHPPRARVFALQLGPRSPSAFRKIRRLWK
jgi:hypothetical protein